MVLLAVGLISLLLEAFFIYIAWRQWNCGLMGLQAVIGAFVAAAGITMVIAGWRRLFPVDKRLNLKMLAVPCVIAVALAIFVFTLAPDCPFTAR
jgi:hypothetical protein